MGWHVIGPDGIGNRTGRDGRDEMGWDRADGMGQSGTGQD